VAAIITSLLVLVTAGVLHLVLTQHDERTGVETRLEGAIRPEMPGFEQFREKILIDQLAAFEAPRSLNDDTLEISATVRNTTDRSLSGLEMRGAIVDAQRSPMRERTVIVVPAQQTVLEPGEAINVRILLQGVSPETERSTVLMDVIGVRFD
jgi:hypothetical protein